VITFSSSNCIDVIYYSVVLSPSIPYWNAFERIAFALLTLFTPFHSIRTKRAESHIRFALELTIHFARQISFFSFIFLLFCHRREARICHYSEYCIMSYLRNHNSMSFIFCIFLLLYLLRIFRHYSIFIHNNASANIFAIVSLNYPAFRQKNSCCFIV